MCFLSFKKNFFRRFFADKAQNFFSDITRTSMFVKNNCHTELVLASLNTHFYSKE